VNLVAPPKAQNADPNLQHLIQIYNSMDLEKRAKILSFAIATDQKDTENEEDEAAGMKLTNVWAGLLKIFTNRKQIMVLFSFLNTLSCQQCLN
jgi:hypothetical protein